MSGILDEYDSRLKKAPIPWLYLFFTTMVPWQLLGTLEVLKFNTINVIAAFAALSLSQFAAWWVFNKHIEILNPKMIQLGLYIPLFGACVYYS